MKLSRKESIAVIAFSLMALIASALGEFKVYEYATHATDFVQMVLYVMGGVALLIVFAVSVVFLYIGLHNLLTHSKIGENYE